MYMDRLGPGGAVGRLLGVLLLVAVAAQTWAQEGAEEADAPPATEPATEEATEEGGEQAVEQADTAEVVTIHVGRSRTLEAPWPVGRVAVTDPEVADVQVLTPRQVLVQGIAPGVTDLLMWSEDEQLWQAMVVVDADLRRLQQHLDKLFPGSELELTQTEGIIAVSGTFRQAEHGEQLRRLLEAIGVAHVDLTRVGGVQQVMVQVRMAEASRSAFRRLGVDFLATGNDVFGVSRPGGSIIPTIGTTEDAATGLASSFLESVEVSPGVTLFAGIPDADLHVFLQALAENQYLRILAEPNLIARSGEEASFLAGGEVPVTTTQGGATSGAVTVQFKEFGVRLTFRPVVKGDGRIELYVAPEVSEVVDVQTLAGGGLAPSFITRRAETTIELHSGQTFAMAGLLEQKSNANVSRLPWLGQVPVLGTLFRSVQYQQDETELVVLVTARLVEPMSGATTRPVPGDLHRTPTDWELYVEGRLEAHNAMDLSPADEGLKEAGLHRLKGPGAWTDHQSVTLQQRRSSRRLNGGERDAD